MKVLLDEQLPRRLRLELSGHDVRTATFSGYGGLSNGRLLAAAAADDFDVLVTNDRHVQDQHNLAQLPIAVVVLNSPSNKLAVIRPRIPALLAALSTLPPRTIVNLI